MCYVEDSHPPFRQTGKQRGFSNPRGTLFFEIIRISEYHKPNVLFLENASNREKHDNGNTLKVILSSLKHISYDVHYKVLNASDYGIAQSRKYIYHVCFRKDLNISFQFLRPFKSNTAIENYLEPCKDESNYIDPAPITYTKMILPTRFPIPTG